jgi:hypothetical protein
MRFGGTYRIHQQGEKNQQVRNSVSSNWLVTSDVFPSLLILSTVMMEVILSCETSVLKTATLRHIPEDRILLKHNMTYKDIVKETWEDKEMDS